MSDFPHFLGIGGSRCGSTWLYYNLIEHPELWLPSHKELHYFSRSTSYPSPSHLVYQSIRQRLFGREVWNRAYRKKLTRHMLGGLLYPRSRPLSFSLRYFFGRHDDDWYASLFTRGAGRITGEITPSYSILNSDDIAHIYELMPNVKIILLMRNPVDRAWSQIKKTDSNPRCVTELSRLLDDDPKFTQYSDYARILSNWGSVFPIDQIFVGFFDDILSRPENLIREVFRFLGARVRADDAFPTAYTQFNPSNHRDFPNVYRQHLATKFLPMLEELSELVGGHTKEWLNEARLHSGKRG